jgi:signal transduction histidine kinase
MFSGEDLLRSDLLFRSDLWNGPLERYARATHLTLKLFDAGGRVVIGPLHSTPLFQLLEEEARYDPGLFAECARCCVGQSADRTEVLLSEFRGLTAVGTPLVLEGKIVGAAVGGYAFVNFSQWAQVQLLSRDSGATFDRLWQVARGQSPIPRHRLTLNGELLQVLGNALLNESYKARVAKLEDALRENAQKHRELEQMASELRKVNDDLQQFAYAASHDLREPLRIITAYSDLLVKSCVDGVNGDGALYARFIQQSTSRVQDLLSDLLTYTQLTEPERESTEWADLNVALEDALKNLKALVEESGAAVSSDALPAFGGHRIHFVQLFQNLIGNAIKYRGAEVPRIRISAQKCESEWRIAVADNGIGIAPEYHRQIFGVFKRLHGRAIPGTGIGLAICKRIVERYGGRIWVESKPGAGATFYFTLPIAESGSK